MAKILKIIFLIISVFLCGSFYAGNSFIFADDALDHIVINEIQISGESADDEFIELYNPTDNTINLENWDLRKKTKSGNEYNILNNIEGTISPRGYFLIVPRANCGENKDEACHTKEVAGDDEYTTDSFLAINNTILLYNNNGDLIDKVGWGEASDFEGEIISVNPENGESLERKSIDNIIQDTDNNNDDFVLSINPNPQNSFEHIPNPSQEGNNSDDNNDSESDDDGTDDQDDLQNDSEQENKDDASAYKIIITEFLPNPEDSDRDNEFIEIYNTGETDANLEGWTLEDKMGKVKVFEILERVEIKSGGYKVFYSDQTRIALNNSGDGVVLKSVNGNIIDETPISDSAKEDQAYALNENGDWVWTLRPTAGRRNIIKEEEHTPSPFQEGNNGDDDKHISISQEGNDNDNNTSDTKQDDSSQETGANDEIEENIEYNFSDEIVISEIYPNPEGSDNRDGNYEWIELYNCSAGDINLIGWQIDDILRKGSKLYTIKENKIISAKSHLVLTNEETKVIFNNSGDEVNLLWPDGTVVDSAQYGKSIEEQSYNWMNGDWTWSQIITPNKNNIANVSGKILGAGSVINSDNEDEMEIDESDVDAEENIADDIQYAETTITKAKELPRFSYVEISGIVSTPPGIFSDNIFYIAGSGIQVYNKNINIFEINIGDEIEISGRISEVGGEKRILLNGMENIKVISQDNLVESKIVSTVDVGEAVEGHLVTVEGEVVEIKNEVFFLNDGSGKVKIYIKPQTGIEKPKIEAGDWMIVTGQVSRTSAGYRILPRFQADLRSSRVSGISASSAVLIEQKSDFINNGENKNETFVLKNANSVIYAIIVLVGVLVLFDWGRMKITKSRKIAKP